jgi:superfamily II DNA or RNA helicase
MELMPHQARLVDDNPQKAIIAWEMRVGKTLPASIWIDRKEQGDNTFVIMPKQTKKDWVEMKTKATLLTKEEFKKTEIVNPTAIIVDEAHYFASALFARKGKGRSDLSLALYNLVKKYPECHILLLTATPIRQDAWSLHTLLCYIGVYINWKDWQREFFEKKAEFFLPRQPWMKEGEVPTAWMPKEDWRINIRKYQDKYCNIVSLRDIKDDLPPITPVIIEVKHKPYEKPTDRVVTWIDEHLYEQEGKIGEILKLGYRKVIVVAHYTKQIDDLAKELGKEKPVYILDGRTKDASKTKEEAQKADDCYFIVQSSMGFGFDGWMFGAIIFASQSHSCLNHTQMSGRLRHLEHLKPYNMYYLIGGKWDRRIYDTIEKGKDFNPHVYVK